MKLLSLYVPERYIEALDLMVSDNLYPNRSEAIRVAIRDLIKNDHMIRMKMEERKKKAK